MPRLSKHEKSGTIGMLQTGLRLTDIALYYNWQSVNYTGPQRSLPGYWGGKRSTTVWSTKNYTTSSRRYIDSVLRPVTLSSLCQNQRRANFIDQHCNAPDHTVRLSVNFEAANIILVLDRLPLSQDRSAIELLIATLKYKGIAI